jgi:alkylhydroperoxidase/carboxymuconolactone decarboxylase family protein YurZ
MSRIPAISLDDVAPPIAALVKAAAPGRDQALNLHAEMAHAPAVLSAYSGIREAISTHGSLDAKTRTAIMLAVCSVEECAYAQALNIRLALRAGWENEQLLAILKADALSDPRLDTLLDVVREAVRNHGRVDDNTWDAAVEAGWTQAQLGDTFAALSLAAFVDHFLHYADTDLDFGALEPDMRAS